MNPHRLTWGFAYNFPFSQLVALALLSGLVFWREPKRFPLSPLSLAWLAFVGWMCVTTIFALYPETAGIQLQKILKIQLMTVVTVLVITNRQRIERLVWVIAFSLGYFGVKGGVAAVLTGGGDRLFGPGGFIEDNNALAIALLIVTPLMCYPLLQTRRRWLRYGLLACVGLTCVAVVSTYSRAAALGGAAMAVAIWVKSRNRILTGGLLMLALPLLYAFAPEAWHERMATIFVDEEDEREVSSASRLQVWGLILRIANDHPITGAGLDPWRWETYAPYTNDLQQAWAAHSIYFSVLAEHGYVGLSLYLIVHLLTWLTASRTIRSCRGVVELQWMSDLMRMIQVSYLGFLVAGAFHQLPYFDLPWHLLAMVIICDRIAREQTAEHRPPAWRGSTRFGRGSSVENV